MKTFIHPSAMIGPDVVIGEGVYIGPGCIIGYPAEHRDHWPNIGQVIILDRSILTGNVTVDAGSERATIIEKNAFIMKGCHIGHDSNISENVTMAPHCVIGGHAIVMKGATLGMSVLVHQRAVIGYYSMLGMGGVVTKKSRVEPYQSYAGNPVRHLGPNKKTIDQLDQNLVEIYNEYVKQLSV
jgi:UDP-N-acetylglucosamine acyltransferase